MGFTIEDDLNTKHCNKLWLEWKRRTDPSHYLDPSKRAEVWRRETLKMVREGLIREEHFYGTINCDGVNAKGEICGVTTTSGLSWKIPGRVGDSPILGAGLYVDGEVGAAGSTGRGEANLYNLCSFFIVEELRRGAHPKDAGMAALKRVANPDATVPSTTATSAHSSRTDRSVTRRSRAGSPSSPATHIASISARPFLIVMSGVMPP